MRMCREAIHVNTGRSRRAVSAPGLDIIISNSETEEVDRIWAEYALLLNVKDIK